MKDVQSDQTVSEKGYDEKGSTTYWYKALSYMNIPFPLENISCVPCK